jgi:16S rRNA (adenine1518-N6/adenine1519-N6)-dimethyltransferase
MDYIRPKKSLGQHFLTDRNIAQKIVNSLHFQGPVIEVGPGKGILTGYLVEKYGPLLKVVEIDNESVVFLEEHKIIPKESIIHGDVLSMDWTTMTGSSFAVIGNFPYNISSPLFFKIIDNRNLVQETICMIQREVALRIAEKPGTKTYGILSVLLQAFYDVEYLFTVNEHVFQPPPKVKSAVIRLTRNRTEQLACDETYFRTVVKTAFNQRRKTLANSLKSLINKSESLNPIFQKRPEQLSVQEFVELTNIIY